MQLPLDLEPRYVVVQYELTELDRRTVMPAVAPQPYEDGYILSVLPTVLRDRMLPEPLGHVCHYVCRCGAPITAADEARYAEVGQRNLLLADKLQTLTDENTQLLAENARLRRAAR